MTVVVRSGHEPGTPHGRRQLLPFLRRHCRPRSPFGQHAAVMRGDIYEVTSIPSEGRPRIIGDPSVRQSERTDGKEVPRD